MSNKLLPPLPTPARVGLAEPGLVVPNYFTAAQMRDYARAALAAQQDAPASDWPDVSPAGLRKMAEIAAPNNGAVFRAAADEIERLSAAQAPEGWKLVPVEPTPAMLVALWDHRERMTGSGENKIARIGYAAMLAAAPNPEASKPAYHPNENSVREACDLLTTVRDAAENWKNQPGGWSGTKAACDQAINLLRYGSEASKPVQAEAPSGCGHCSHGGWCGRRDCKNIVVHSPASGAVERVHGFKRHDLETMADGLEAYEKTIDTGDGHVESTTAWAARFIRAAIATQPLEQKPVDLEHIADVNYQRGEEIGYRMGLAAARRAHPEQVAQDTPDMFWDHDDGERFGHDIYEIIADYGPGEIVKIDQAKRLPSVTVRVLPAKDDESDLEYEFIEDDRAARASGQEGEKK